MDDVKVMCADQVSRQAALPDLGVKVAERPERKYRHAIRYQLPDLIAPDVYETIGNEMQAFNVIWKGAAKFRLGAFMCQQMHINIH